MKHVIVLVMSAIFLCGCGSGNSQKNVKQQMTDGADLSIERFDVHGPVRDIAISAKKNIAAVIYEDSRPLSLFDVTTGAEISQLKEVLQKPQCTVVSPNGELLAVGCNEGVEIWSLQSRALVHTLRHDPAWNVALAFSPNSEFLYCAPLGPEGVVRKIDLNSYEAEIIFDESKDNLLRDDQFPGGVFSIAVSPDGSILAVRVPLGVLTIDVANRTVSVAIRDPSVGIRLSFTPDGRLLVTLKPHVTLWNIQTGKKADEFEVGVFTEYLIHPTRRLLIAVDGGNVAKPSHMIVVDLSSGALRHRFRCHNDVVLATEFADFESTIATGGMDGTLALWDISKFLENAEKWGR